VTLSQKPCPTGVWQHTQQQKKQQQQEKQQKRKTTIRKTTSTRKATTTRKTTTNAKDAASLHKGIWRFRCHTDSRTCSRSDISSARPLGKRGKSQRQAIDHSIAK
jgi:hypothetical protein